MCFNAFIISSHYYGVRSAQLTNRDRDKLHDLMLVSQLKKELAKLGLPTKGLKKQLQQRYDAAVAAGATAAQAADKEDDTEPVCLTKLCHDGVDATLRDA